MSNLCLNSVGGMGSEGDGIPFIGDIVLGGIISCDNMLIGQVRREKYNNEQWNAFSLILTSFVVYHDCSGNKNTHFLAFSKEIRCKVVVLITPLYEIES